MTPPRLPERRGNFLSFPEARLLIIDFINIYSMFTFIKLLQIYKFCKSNSTFHIIDFYSF